MINHKSSFYLGVFVFIIPFLGFPTVWKMVLVVVAGVFLILSSIKISVPKRIFKNKTKKEMTVPIMEISRTESVPPPQNFEVIQNMDETEIVHPPVAIKKVRRSTKVDSVKKSSVKEQ